MNMDSVFKLGKEYLPWLEPRILLKDPVKSYCAQSWDIYLLERTYYALSKQNICFL